MKNSDRSRVALLLFLCLWLTTACRSEPEPATAAARPAPAAAAVPRIRGAESGANRWKDTAVYVDGQPVGMLAFAELPISLAPVWIEDEVSVTVKPGHKGPAFRRAKQRQYRFTDYLRAVGVDLGAVKELHVQGPKTSEILVVTGEELRRRGDEMRFRFGGDVAGKAIPVVPDGIGNRRSPDKIAAVMVYVAQTPPTVVRNVGLVLNGAPVAGVPYAGEPIRGGVHIYVDDRLATVLKRRHLGDEANQAVPGGEARRPVLPLLEAQGIDTRGLVELWIIQGNRRQERIPRAQLASATLELGRSARAVIRLADREILAGALAFHSRAVRPDELPTILPEEEE